MVWGAGWLASLTFAPSAARPRPPNITGALAIRSASDVSPTAHSAMVDSAVVIPRIWVRYPLAEPPVISQAKVQHSCLRSRMRWIKETRRAA